MDNTWILGVLGAALVAAIYFWFYHPLMTEEGKLKQLQSDMDVLETHIRHFLMSWWRAGGNEDPAFRWRLKVSMVSGQCCAYAWRHCRRNPGEPLKVVVHSKYWPHFNGHPLDRDSRIMDEALQFVETAFKKPATPISGAIRDQDDD